MSEDPDFKYIIRIANSDVSGEQRLGYALTSIRGIGSRISNAIIQNLKLDSEELAGKLTDKNVEDIESDQEMDMLEEINDLLKPLQVLGPVDTKTLDKDEQFPGVVRIIY